ncbi:hypothetical protein ACNPNP_11845 [Microbacterium sp. AGC85]
MRAEDLGDRLDVKANLVRPGERVDAWKEVGLTVVSVDRVLAPVTSLTVPGSDEEGRATFLRVRGDGLCEAGDDFWLGGAAPLEFTRVRTGDLVFSHTNTVHGAVGIVPQELDGCVVTNEYFVCRAVDEKDAPVVWTLLRSTQARADLIALATGIGQTRVSWSEISELQLPWPDEPLRKVIRDAFAEANEAERRAQQLRLETALKVSDQLGLAPARAHEVVSAFQPPR